MSLYKLTQLKAASLVKTGRPARTGDGGGLWLDVRGAGRAVWVFRYSRQGKAHEAGLGSFRDVSLSVARDKANAHRKLLAEGRDPIAYQSAEEKARLEGERQQQLAMDRCKFTFQFVAEERIAAKEAEYRNAKHRQQWRSSLETYAYPIIGSKPVDEIDQEDVLAVLRPIWLEKTETASRVRQRIEKVLDFAAAPKRRLRSGENPARWRGNLEHELPRKSQIKKERHHPSLSWGEIREFIFALDEHECMTAQVLKFIILTACRSGEARGATWGEIDTDKAIWTIPGNKMKAGKLHRLPLSNPALELLKRVRPLSSGKQYDLVFPSPVSGKKLSDMALSQLLRGMSFDGLPEGQLPRWHDDESRAVVAHGFRSTFKGWSLSKGYQDHLSELALAHKDKNKVRAAYARDDLLEERRPMMEDWGSFCAAPTASVTNIKNARRA
jgi:integrase